MKSQRLIVVFILAGLMFSMPAVSFAASTDLAHLINVAGKQRMLSQRISKAYFFLGQRIRPEKSRQQLKKSMDEFDRNHALLKRMVRNEEIQQMLTFLEFQKDDYKNLVLAPYNEDNAAIVLDYAEVLLEGSQDVVRRLESGSKLHKEAIVDLSGRQRMLSQRIAMFYIAYQAGFNHKHKVEQMEKAVLEFEKAQNELLGEKRNTPQISTELGKVKNLWEVVRKFYMDIEAGGLPVIVFSTSDHIMDGMNRVTGMYADHVSGLRAAQVAKQ